MKQDLVKEIELPDGVTAEQKNSGLLVKGPQGEVEKIFPHPKVTITIEGNKIILKATKVSKRERTIVGSFIAHIGNMIQGVQEPYIYNLAICSGHFPMNVSVANEEVVIKNFLGESIPRKVAIIKGTTVKVDGKEVIVNSPDKSAAGQMAARIEKLCRITNRDLRIFMDGVWITAKCGKKV